jgi:Apoptosis inhibitory protein 5 (API5)
LKLVLLILWDQFLIFFLCNLNISYHLYELQIRVQAIRGLPLLCKDTPGYVSKIVDVLGQLLGSGRYSCIFYFHSSYLLLFSIFLILRTYFTFLEENVERDAVHKALMSLLRQDVKGR